MKQKFKVGDRVIRTSGDYNRMYASDTDTIRSIKYYPDSIDLVKFGRGHSPTKFKVIGPALYKIHQL